MPQLGPDLPGLGYVLISQPFWPAAWGIHLKLKEPHPHSQTTGRLTAPQRERMLCREKNTSCLLHIIFKDSVVHAQLFNTLL